MRVLVLAMALSGCAQTLANLNGRLTPEQEQQLVVQWVQQCEALGYQRDTDPWRDCILKQRDYSLRRAQVEYDAYQRNQPTSCRRDSFGTTCY